MFASSIHSLVLGGDGWWNPQWKYRKLIRVTVPPLPAPELFSPSPNLTPSSKEVISRALALPLFVRVRLNGEGNFAPDGKDLRVINTSGKLVPHLLASLQETGEAIIFFKPTVIATGDYWVYYGNPKAPAPKSPEWKVPSGVGFVRVFRHTYGGFPYSPSALRTAMKRLSLPLASRWVAVPKLLRSSPALSLSRGETVLTLSHGFLRIPVEDRYWFALNAGGCAVLYLNGEEVQSTQGLRRPNLVEWPRRKRYELSRGWYHYLVVQAESATRYGLALGVRRSGKSLFTPISPPFGQNFLEAEVRRFDSVEDEARVFFSYETAPVAVKLVEGKIVAYVEFLTRFPIPDGARLLWTIDKEEMEGRRAYALLELGKQHTVTLRLSRDARTLGSYTRLLSIPSLPLEKAEVHFDIIYFPHIVYSTEDTNLTFRVTNETSSPIIARCEVRLSGFDGSGGKSFDLVLPARGEDSASFPISFSEFKAPTGTIQTRITIGNEEYVNESIRVIRSPRGISALEASLGYLWNQEGERIIIVAELEDPARYRRWAPLRWLKARTSRRPPRILLFGSPMQNTPASAKPFKNYVAHLKSVLSSRVESFNFVSRSGRPNPLLSDLPLFARKLSERKLNTFIISPGPEDAFCGESVWLFERSLDVMIDLIREKEERARIILVSPPPLAENPRLSRPYHDAMRRIARTHHTAFVDLGKIFSGEKSDWLRLYREPGGKIIHFYPNEEAQKRIAEEISEYVR